MVSKYMMTILRVLLILVVSISSTGRLRAADDGEYPKLISTVGCGLDSRYHKAPCDLTFVTSVHEAGAKWQYEYLVVNRTSSDLSLFVLTLINGRIEFASGFMTNSGRNADVQNSLGPFIIRIPRHSRKRFVVYDRAGPIEITGHLRRIDRHGVVIGGGDVTLYFPAWSRFFR